MNRRKIILGLVVLAAVAGGLIWRFVLSRSDPKGGNVVRVSGNVELTDVEMAFKIPGLVAQRRVDEGYDVRKDQVVAVLETADLEADLAVRRAELGMAKAALKELKAGSRQEEKDAAKAAMEKAAAALRALQSDSPRLRMEAAKASAALKAAEFEEARLESELKRAAEMRRINPDAISQEQYDQQKAAYDVAVSRRKEAEEQYHMTGEPARLEQIEQAQNALDQAKAQWELVEKGPRPEVIEQAEAKRDQAEAAVKVVETRLQYATVKAPFDGVVLAKHAEPAEYVAAGTPVVTVGDMEHVWLRAYINEQDVTRVKYGQRARVTTDSYPRKSYEGYVSFIASDAEFTPKSVQTPKERVKLVYRIKIDVLKNPSHELKRGMPADAEILLDEMAAGVPGKPGAKPG